MRPGVGLAALVLLAALACSGGPGEEAASGEIATYSVRGLVRQAPTPERPQMLVYHEAIPAFADADGNVVGMDSMSMPFDLAEGVDVAGIEAGDKIRFDLEVEWSRTVPGLVTAVEELPADTELQLDS